MNINWENVADQFGMFRRNPVSTRRNSDRLRQPPKKKPRLDADLDVSICPEMFPEIVVSRDGVEDPARFLIDAVHTKIFINAVTSLTRFGDSLVLFPSREGLTIKACNLTRTAAGHFTFCVDFFGAIHTFEFPSNKPCVRILTKSILIILKKIEIAKKLSYFILDIDSDAEVIAMRVFLRNGVNRIYQISLMDVLANSLPRIVTRDNTQSVIVLMARQLCEALHVVEKDAQNIGFWGSNRDVIFHTMFQAPYAPGNWRKAAIKVSDFINIKINKMASFSFVIKDVRGLAKFADRYNSSIALYFKAPKSALFAVVDIPGICEATFTIATNPIVDEETGGLIAQLIPDVELDISVATQIRKFLFDSRPSKGDLGQNNSITTSQNRTILSSSQSQFEPVELDQHHELVQLINELPFSYWTEAISVGPFETVVHG